MKQPITSPQHSQVMLEKSSCGQSPSDVFERALIDAQNELDAGHFRCIFVGKDADVGRFIDVETEQGWVPGHFWQEFESEPPQRGPRE